MDKLTTFHHLREADEHIAAQFKIVEGQRRLIRTLEAKGLDTECARALLAQLEEIGMTYELDRGRLLRELMN